jgi:hypothetical protein
MQGSRFSTSSHVSGSLLLSCQERKAVCHEMRILSLASTEGMKCHILHAGYDQAYLVDISGDSAPLTGRLQGTPLVYFTPRQHIDTL